MLSTGAAGQAAAGAQVVDPVQLDERVFTPKNTTDLTISTPVITRNGAQRSGPAAMDLGAALARARWWCRSRNSPISMAAILAEDPGSDRTLAELGRAVGAGERTLSRLFHAETGMTFPQWRAQLRLHHSLTLLASGLSVTTTAITCGYSTPSAFTAAFHATFGTTPGTYRKNLAHARAA